MTYNADNQIATFNGNGVTYDADGNLTSGPLTNNMFVSYTYDARNRLLSAGGLNYGYDPSANRVAITNGANVTRFVVNPNAALSQVLVRTKPDGSKTFYVYGVGLLYEVNETAGGVETSTRTYHYDYRGSTVALTDGNGNVTARIEYSPYGTTTYRTGNTDTPFLFNGRYGVQTDANGLLYMRARYYNPYLCRFLNPDPSGFTGGLNFYAYADGNPVSLIDPFGLGPQEAGWGSQFAGWIDRNVTSRLNSVSTSYTLPNYFAYNVGPWGGLRICSGWAKARVCDLPRARWLGRGDGHYQRRGPRGVNIAYRWWRIARRGRQRRDDDNRNWLSRNEPRKCSIHYGERIMGILIRAAWWRGRVCQQYICGRNC